MRRTPKTLIAAALGALALAAAVPAAAGAHAFAPVAQAPAVTPPAGTVISWNRYLLGLQSTPGNQPATVHPTYELAITHAAIYDAVVSVERNAAPYLFSVDSPRDASAAAAADAAAHDVLVALYPGLRASTDQEYAGLIARVPAGRRRQEGIHVGRLVAAKLLARRAGDGADATPVGFQPGSAPGEYQLTPPAFAQPVFTHWGRVRPFVLRRSDEFRPPAPPALTSPKYAAAIDEVKALGAATGSTRTPDQTQIGLFWNGPIWATWNEIAQTAALGHKHNLIRDAHTFAALDLTFADAVIAFYDAKYAYHFWRPVTAIRAADDDGNPDTAGDPNWTPLSNTAPDPAYPGAHGTIGAAGADVLAAAYGNDFAFTATSDSLAGVTRSFTSFSEAGHEASVSRIYNGNHTRLDQVAGENLGHDVARSVLDFTLLPRAERTN